MEYLLKKTDDKKQKAYLINYFLEQFRTTLYRQTMFAEFELKINQMTENGEGLTADNISQLYYELNKLYFGDDMIVDEEIALEWARIPHFYYDYYVQYDYIASSEKLALDNVNTTYGYSKSNKGYQNLRDSGTINVNNREFRVFDGGYYESVFSVVGSKDVFVNVKYLVCHIGKQYLVIELKGSGVQISNEVLNEITNFEVEERKEKR
jgi:hypothetical protein